MPTLNANNGGKCKLQLETANLPECLVHGGEVDDGVSVDVVLVQGPARLVQPLVLARPPDGVV